MIADRPRSLALLVGLLAVAACQPAPLKGKGSTSANPLGVSSPGIATAGLVQARALTGKVKGAAGLVGDAGGTVVSNNGGSLVSKVRNYGGARYATQAISEAPLAGAAVYLADAAGQPLPDVPPAVTDASGNFVFLNVPAGFTVTVVAAAKTATGKAAALRAIARTGDGGPVEVGFPSTLVTAAVTEGKSGLLGNVSAGAYMEALKAVADALEADGLPDLGEPGAALAAAQALAAKLAPLKAAIGKLEAEVAKRDAEIASLTAQIATLKQQNQAPAGVGGPAVATTGSPAPGGIVPPATATAPPPARVQEAPPAARTIAEAEPNQDFRTAQLLQINDTVTGTLPDGANDHDYFMFKVPAGNDGLVHYLLEGVEAEAKPPQIEWFNGSKARGFGTGWANLPGDIKGDWRVAGGGTYYVHLFSPDNDYSFKLAYERVEDPTEPNDDAPQASLVQDGVPFDVFIFSAQDKPEDLDFFALDVPAGRTSLRVQLTNMSPPGMKRSYPFDVYDAKKNNLGGAYPQDGADIDQEIKVTGGQRCYVRFKGMSDVPTPSRATLTTR